MARPQSDRTVIRDGKVRDIDHRPITRFSTR
jgi:hypothetical protein